MTPHELKKLLQSKGLEIYRTTAEEVILAERVRDNLLMDSGVAVRVAPLAIRLIVRAQSSVFPGEDADRLFTRVRASAQAAFAAGFSETQTKVVAILDPGDRSRTLDTAHELWLERSVSSLEALETELRAALALSKTAT